MILLQLAGRRAELLRYAADADARTGDPLWGSLVVVESALIGEHQAARAALPRSFPGLLGIRPKSRAIAKPTPVVTAAVLQRTGGEAQARQMLERLLAGSTGSSTRAPTSWPRAAWRSPRSAGATRRSRVRGGGAAGWRLLIDFDYFVRRRPIIRSWPRSPAIRASS